MTNNSESSNGWSEYKMTVIQQLEYLTREVKDVRAAVNQLDKDLQAMVTRDKLEADIAILNNKREMDLINLAKKRDENQITAAIKINEVIENLKEHCKENDDWKLEVSNTLAVSKARDEASRKSWTIVTVAISLAINAAALILAFIIHASRATP